MSFVLKLMSQSILKKKFALDYVMELNEKSEDHQSNYSSARGGLKRLHQNSHPSCRS